MSIDRPSDFTDLGRVVGRRGESLLRVNPVDRLLRLLGRPPRLLLLMPGVHAANLDLADVGGPHRPAPPLQLNAQRRLFPGTGFGNELRLARWSGADLRVD